MKKSLERAHQMWNHLGEMDPMWAIMTEPDKFGNRWTEDDFFASGRVEIDTLIETLNQAAPSRRSDRVLDFGCGIGRLSRALCNHFDRVDGVDVAPSMIKLAAEKNAFPERCSFHLNEASDLAIFADNTFDLIYSNIVLQHMSPDLALEYLKEFVRCTRPGGLIVFQVPHSRRLNARSVKEVVMNAIYHLLPMNLIVRYRRRKYGGLPTSIVERLPKFPMDTNSIRRKKVEATLQGCRMIKIENTTKSKDAFVSYTYLFEKAGAAAVRFC